MNYTENFEGIKIDVQAVDITIQDELQQQIRDSLKKLQRHTRVINWVDVYFNSNPAHSTQNKTVGMRLGIPGTDVFAEDTGDHFAPLLRSVEDKLRRQLEKR